MDRVDLQEAHAFDRGRHVGFARATARFREQALREEVEVAGLLLAEVDRRGHDGSCN